MRHLQMYALIRAFERDMRSMLEGYVVPELGDDDAVYGPEVPKLVARRSSDGSEKASLSEFLDFQESYDLLNRHRSNLPVALARDIRDNTVALVPMSQIRHRVMHSRPLHEQDLRELTSFIAGFSTPYWRQTHAASASLAHDPNWVPEEAFELEPDRHPHNLPLGDFDETGLVGRDSDVKEISKILKVGRDSVVTLCGEGGIGKTALAIQVAYDLLDDDESPFDVYLWASLKSEKLTANGIQKIANNARDLSEVVATLERGIPANPGAVIEDLATAIQAFKRPLVIIDNLETVTGDDFVQLYENLPESITYLVTSREGIGQLERRRQVPPLSPKYSLQLLNNLIRERSATPLERLSNTSRQQIVEQLRNSPLAIRWFVLSTEAGRDPISLLKHQEDLLRFCVDSVFQRLSDLAKSVLVALDTLGEPTTQDELVVLLESDVEQTAIGIRELTRCSLVTTTIEQGATMRTLIELTETARRYATIVLRDLQETRVLVRQNQSQFRENEERRLKEEHSRALGPNVVRIRTKADAATAQLLRQALTHSKDADLPGALQLIEEARKLNPEYWEVDRVEGTIRSFSNDIELATAAYYRALTNAPTNEERAIIAYYFAGHLGRRARDLELAQEFAEEAHQTLKSPETAHQLGNILVWREEFESGEYWLNFAAQNGSGALENIAWTALARAKVRRAEHAMEVSHNPSLAASFSASGFYVLAPRISQGAADRLLLEACAEALTLTLRFMSNADFFDTILDTSPELQDLGTAAVPIAHVLMRTSRSEQLKAASLRSIRRHPDSSELLDLARALGVGNSSSHSGANLESEAAAVTGVVFSVLKTFAFVDCPGYVERVFCHKSAFEFQDEFSSLVPGDSIDVQVGLDGEGRLRAVNAYRRSSL